jgi:hypothetical protein
MKRILLTTTALTMTAGIAAAEVSVTGDFRLGFNDTVANDSAAKFAVGDAQYVAPAIQDNKAGIYNDAGVTFGMSSTLDNGMAASISLDMSGDDGAQATDKYKFSLSNDSTSVTFGTTEYSAITNWTSAGAMATDTWANQNADNKNVLRAETTVGGLKVSVSSNMVQLTQGAAATAAQQAAAAAGATDPLSITIGGSLGGASYVIANEGSKMGIAATTAVGGATVTTAYSTAPTRTTGDKTTAPTDDASAMNTSTGVKIAYPMGAIVATASYVMEGNGTCTTALLPVTAGSCVQNSDTWDISAVWTSGDTKVTFATDEGSDNKIEGSTKLGAATIAAGLTDKLKDMYLSVTNPLGGGASIMASYAIDGDGSADAGDEVGGPDLQEGLTVELKFAF